MIDEIRRRGGAIPFDEFMDLALYHPVHGYYSSERVPYGRGGDFLTAPTASSWYGSVVGGALKQLGEAVGPLVLVDLASGDGAFVAGIREGPEHAARPPLQRIVSVERSEARRRAQQRRFAEDPRVTVVASLEDVAPPQAPVVLHASELYDALPVRRVVRRESGLMELWVGAGDGSLAWAERPARAETAAYLENHGVELETGQVAEVSLHAASLHRKLLAWAGRDALALVLDYGYPADRLYDPRGRRGGSLACFRRHELSRDPLASPGEQDITAHVNWDDLRRPAAALGWREIGLWPLAELLVRAGLERAVAARGLGIETELSAEVYARRQEIKRPLEPGGMGSDLKVLVQGTGALGEAAERLLGGDLGARSQ